MNLKHFFSSLDDKEKRELSEICLNYLNVKSENLITILDAISNYKMSKRLENVLLANYGENYLIQTINFQDLLRLRDSGRKTAMEFKELKYKINSQC